eukprot:2526291-Rhodomonas_salina.1
MGRTGEKGDCVMPRHTWGLFSRSLQHHLPATSPEVAPKRPGLQTLSWMIEDLGPCGLLDA